MAPVAGLFQAKKAEILRKLSVPEGEYADASPKGCVDEAIRDLIAEVNACEGLVTTSSCSGRVTVFLEGRRRRPDGPVAAPNQGDAAGPGENAAEAERAQVASQGGKGGGGDFLFVSHDPLQEAATGYAAGDDGEDEPDWFGIFGFSPEGQPSHPDVYNADTSAVAAAAFLHNALAAGTASLRWIKFKYEPMIMHVLAASLEDADLLVKCGLEAGFRESGAINLVPHAPRGCGRHHHHQQQLTAATPMVAIRSMGLGFESVIGFQSDGDEDEEGGGIQRHCFVSPSYLDSIVALANERFEANRIRVERFRTALRKKFVVAAGCA